MAGQIPREFIDSLLARIDLVALIQIRFPLQKKSNNNYFACCPFHQEKSASFSVSQNKQFYHCFGCGAHGNAIDFLMQHERLSFPDAIQALASEVGMPMPTTVALPSGKQNALQSLYAINEKAAIFYYEQMRQSARAVAYLKKRGIDGVITKQFHLGYAPPGWHTLITHLGKNSEYKKNLLDAGLIINKSMNSHYDRFRDRIMFPIQDHRGRFIGFGGRVLDQDEPKYLNSPETLVFQKGHELYGLYQSLKHNQLNKILVVEGYMDVIALHQHGIKYAVATQGTAATSHHLQRLLRYTQHIIFCFDGDAAGRTAGWRALQIMLVLLDEQLQIRFLFLPEGEDPDTLIRKEGAAQFEKRIEEAWPLSEFLFQNLSQQADLGTVEGRAQFAAKVIEMIKLIKNDLLLSMLLEELAKRSRIDLTTLQTKLESFKKRAEISSMTSTANKNTHHLSKPLKLAIALLLQYPHLMQIEFLEEATQIQELEEEGIAILWELITILQTNPHASSAMLLEYWRGRPELPLLAELLHWNHLVPETGLKAAWLGAMRQLMINDINNKINHLLAKSAQGVITRLEKQALYSYINKKKELLNSVPTESH